MIVDIEAAKKLKVEGYSKPCEYFYQDVDLPYSPKGLKKTKNGKRMNHNRYDEFIYSAPTIEDANIFFNKKHIKYDIILTNNNIEHFKRQINFKMKTLFGVDDWIGFYENEHNIKLYDFIGISFDDVIYELSKNLNKMYTLQKMTSCKLYDKNNGTYPNKK